eukprot:CAMPEP_0203923190 /NCGR_PEP_ID=MMETSP0359-20131031/63123_1 /ASSEMBLY_ACC=CAM_ASM_000338 /TAXON_ID=268821 /ORGANISM="Scrippsiella Hangoei, Strain SHTV-5" /LENGTH=36 /DNA_ID= /DNA_START= /DNA_END= /DNA_ORIENTATION=
MGGTVSREADPSVGRQAPDIIGPPLTGESEESELPE